MRQNIEKGLERSLWLFSLAVGIITVCFYIVNDPYNFLYDWGHILITAISLSVIGFLFFRVVIWVIRGFIPNDSLKQTDGLK